MEHTARTNEHVSRVPKLSIFLSFSARNSVTRSNGQASSPNITSMDPESIARSLIAQGYTIHQSSSSASISNRDDSQQILGPIFHSDVALCFASDEYWSDPACILEFTLIAYTIAMPYAIVCIDSQSSSKPKLHLARNARLIEHPLFDVPTMIPQIVAFISSPSTHQAVSSHQVFRKGVFHDSRFELEIVNDALVLEHYFRAASKRSHRAECMLGDFYLEGRGSLPVDERQAVDWYKQAVGSGDVVAITRLARMYELGVHGVLAKDTRVACEMYQKAFVEQGYRGAEMSLKRLVCNNRRGFFASYKDTQAFEGAAWTSGVDTGARFWDESGQESRVLIVGACAHVVLTQTFKVRHQDISRDDKFGLFCFPIPEGVSIVGFECDAATWNAIPGLPEFFRVSFKHISTLRCVTTKLKYVQHLRPHRKPESMLFKILAKSPLAMSDKLTETIQSSAHVQVVVIKPIESISSPSHHELSIVHTDADANVQILVGNNNALESDPEISLEIQLSEPCNAYCVAERDEYSGTTALGVAFIPPKHHMVQKSNVAFLVDASSSMQGVKSKLAQDSVMHLLSLLPSTFSFNVHLFGSTSKSMSAKYETLSDVTVATAKNFLNLRHSDLGNTTNLFSALESVFEQNSAEAIAPVQIIIVSDGLLSNVNPVCAFLLQKCGQRPMQSFARVFAVGVGILDDFESLDRIATSGGGFTCRMEGFGLMEEQLEPMKRALVEPAWSDVQVQVQSRDRNGFLNFSLGRCGGQSGVSLFSTYALLPSGFITSSQVRISGISSNGAIELFTPVVELQLSQDKVIHAFAACGSYAGDVTNTSRRYQFNQMEKLSHVIELEETSDNLQNGSTQSQPSIVIRVDNAPPISEAMMRKIEDGSKRRKVLVLCLVAGLVIIVGAIIAMKVVGVFG
ncbi:von Willebrand factor A domain-containing protein 5A [Chytriomyces hyalinus]|nr:von Willebrand factor A domain-containing protein 5A [Chytriomyces hyalinus]